MPQEEIMMLESWDEFPSSLEQLKHFREKKEADNNRALQEPLFRGLGNSEWPLKTTLERSSDAETNETLLTYYRKAARTKPAVESLTGRSWNDIPDYLEFERLVQDGHWIDMTLSRNSAIYEYLLYLRHHGFPSPILDWTVSPYVAALFAFDAMPETASHVLLYVYFRDTMQVGGSDAHLFVVGPYVRTHPRHYLQQSRYSICVQTIWEQHGEKVHIDYKFLPHGDVLTDSMNDDLIIKLLIPATERKRALRQLDLMSLNPYSVLGSEEALIRTIGRRELLFRNE
jgi:FRG domain